MSCMKKTHCTSKFSAPASEPAMTSWAIHRFPISVDISLIRANWTPISKVMDTFSIEGAEDLRITKACNLDSFYYEKNVIIIQAKHSILGALYAEDCNRRLLRRSLFFFELKTPQLLEERVWSRAREGRAKNEGKWGFDILFPR